MNEHAATAGQQDEMNLWKLLYIVHVHVDMQNLAAKKNGKTSNYNMLLSFGHEKVMISVITKQSQGYLFEAFSLYTCILLFVIISVDWKKWAYDALKL